jgi:hypothetical protein
MMGCLRWMPSSTTRCPSSRRPKPEMSARCVEPMPFMGEKQAGDGMQCSGFVEPFSVLSAHMSAPKDLAWRWRPLVQMALRYFRKKMHRF